MPVRERDTGRVIAVAEFYQDARALEARRRRPPLSSAPYRRSPAVMSIPAPAPAGNTNET